MLPFNKDDYDNEEEYLYETTRFLLHNQNDMKEETEEGSSSSSIYDSYNNNNNNNNITESLISGMDTGTPISSDFDDNIFSHDMITPTSSPAPVVGSSSMAPIALATSTSTTAAAAAGMATAIAGFTAEQEMTLCWVTRISAVISFISGIYIFSMAWDRRHHSYHRLMLGLSIHILLWSPWNMAAMAAVPAGTAGMTGAIGNTQTCSAQGFFIQLSTCIPLYFVFLSCHSYSVIIFNFDPDKYAKFEKYIHILVHIYPIASAIYLLQIEAFNSTGFGQCWISSIPFGCGDGSDIECERGPQNITEILIYFAGLPAIFFLIFPTIMMISLCVIVWKKHKEHDHRIPQNSRHGVAIKIQQQEKQDSKSSDILTISTVPAGEQQTGGGVEGATTSPTSGNRRLLISTSMAIRQSLVYIGVLYWIYIPLFLAICFSVIRNQMHFGICMYHSIIYVSMGLWIALMYWFFSTTAISRGMIKYWDTLRIRVKTPMWKRVSKSFQTTFHDSDGSNDKDDRGDGEGSNNSTANDDLEKVRTSSGDEQDKKDDGNSNEKINSIDGESETTISRLAKSKAARRNTFHYGMYDHRDVVAAAGKSGNGDEGGESSLSSPNKKKKQQQRYSFNIFDGTRPNEGSNFNDFIFDGSSDDEMDDQKESEYWAGCQNLY